MRCEGHLCDLISVLRQCLKGWALGLIFALSLHVNGHILSLRRKQFHFATLQVHGLQGPLHAACKLVRSSPSSFFFFLAASCEMQRVTPAHPRNHLSDSSSPEAINPLGAFLTFQVSSAAGLPPHNPVLFL